MISLLRCSNYNGKNTCKENGTCDGKCSWMEEQIRLENTPKAGETVTLPTKKLETMMFKVFNILLNICIEKFFNFRNLRSSRFSSDVVDFLQLIRVLFDFSYL